MKAISKFSPLLNGMVSGLLFGIIMSVVLGVIYYLTPIKENMLTSISLIIIILSTFWGGKTTATMAGTKGLFWGISVGVVIFLAIMGVTIILGNELAFSMLIKKLLFCIIGGALGGIFGVSK